jgi:hypothetical protein
MNRPAEAGRPVPEHADALQMEPRVIPIAQLHRGCTVLYSTHTAPHTAHAQHTMPCSATAAGHGGANCSFSMRSIYHEHDIWNEFVVGRWAYTAGSPPSLMIERACCSRAHTRRCSLAC